MSEIIMRKEEKIYCVDVY